MSKQAREGKRREKDNGKREEGGQQVGEETCRKEKEGGKGRRERMKKKSDKRGEGSEE